MRAGRLRQRVQIKTPVEARNAYGERITTWSTLATVWAAVEPIRGREFFEAETVQAEITHRVILRYYPGIVPRYRVVFEGRVLEIQAVINVDERSRELQLMCRELVE